MAELQVATRIEVAGMLVAAAIEKGLLPKELRRDGGYTAEELGEAIGKVYAKVWQAVNEPQKK